MEEFVLGCVYVYVYVYVLPRLASLVVYEAIHARVRCTFFEAQKVRSDDVYWLILNTECSYAALVPCEDCRMLES